MPPPVRNAFASFFGSLVESCALRQDQPSSTARPIRESWNSHQRICSISLTAPLPPPRLDRSASALWPPAAYAAAARSNSRSWDAAPASNGHHAPLVRRAISRKRTFCDRVAPLLKHQSRHSEQSQLARERTEIVNRFFHRVADVNQRIDFAGFAFGAHMFEHAADLRMPALAAYASHDFAEPCRIGIPLRRAAFAQSPEIDQLHVEPADRARLLEHFRLKLAGEIPGRLPAHGGIERECEPSTAAIGPRPKRFGFGEKSVDLATRGSLRGRMLVGLCRSLIFRIHEAIDRVFWSAAQLVACPALVGEQFRAVERLPPRPQPFRLRFGAALAALVDRQHQRIDQRPDFVARGKM